MDIITGPELTRYVGTPAPSPGRAEVLAEFANGLVTEAWTKDVTTPVPFWVRSIALEAAARPVRNPKGLESWTRSLDDASRTERMPKDAARAGVFLTDDEVKRLRTGNTGRSRRRRYGTVRTPAGY